MPKHQHELDQLDNRHRKVYDLLPGDHAESVTDLVARLKANGHSDEFTHIVRVCNELANQGFAKRSSRKSGGRTFECFQRVEVKATRRKAKPKVELPPDEPQLCDLGKLKVQTRMVQTFTASLDAEAITDLVRLAHGIPPDTKVEVWVEVPGGGDWSACPLHIGVDADVQVRWTVEETD